MNQKTTYSSVEEQFVSSVSTQNPSKQEIKNYRSALKSWLEAFGLSPDSPVGKEFGGEFGAACVKYRRRLEAEGLQPSTCASRLSLIRKIRGYYLQNFDDLQPHGTFHGRLRHFVALRGYSLARFVNTFLKGRVTIETFRSWCTGRRVPRVNKYELIKDIESVLEISEGTLLYKLGWREPFERGGKKKSGVEEPNVRQKPYWIWTAQLAAEYEEIKAFHTAVIPPHGMSRSQRAVWTSTEGAEYPSAEIYLSLMKALAGFCVLPEDASDPMLRGLGMKKEDITLGLLADADVIEKFLTVFRLARSGGKYNNYHIVFLTIATATLREGTGYIFQTPSFAAKLGLNLSVDEWQRKCLAACRRLLELKSAILNMKKSGSSDYEMGRDPYTPLAAILSLQQPLTVTLKMVADMLSDVDNAALPPRTRACLFRDALLAALLQANPLRIRQFAIMKFGVNLIREDDGSWWFKFKRNAFKNRRSLNSDYHIKLAPETWSLIERYKSEFRPLLNNPDASQHVFLSFTDKALKCTPVSTHQLTQIIRKRSKQYIPGCSGFGAHAYRHIVATSIIKNSPSGMGMFLAAKVLQDRVDTVEASYAHLRTNDYVEPYNAFLSDLWRSVYKDRNNHIAGGDAAAEKGGAE